jgi:fatty acid amide hydrolase
LTPVFSVIAPKQDDNISDLLYSYSNALYWNMLGLPAGVVPITQVNMDETHYKDGQNDEFEYHANKAMQESTGMPVGVQISGMPHQDEIVLRVMRELEAKARFKLPL